MLTSVTRVHAHRLKTVVLLQHRAGPFPRTAHVTTTGKVVSVVSDWSWVPVLESYITALQIRKMLLRIGTRRSVGGADAGRVGWRRLFNSVINKMAVRTRQQVAIAPHAVAYLFTAGIVFPSVFAGSLLLSSSAYA